MTNKSKHTAFSAATTLSAGRETINTNFQNAGLATILSANNAGSPYTLAADYDRVHVDASSGAVTVNLPASPDDGDTYVFVLTDATNALTIGRNGNTINGSAADSTISVQWNAYEFVWDDTASNWVRR